MDSIGLKRKKDLPWFQDERQTTEFQAKYFDKQISFRSSIKHEEDKLLKETLIRIKSIKIKDPIDATLKFLHPNITQIGLKNVKIKSAVSQQLIENHEKILYVKDNLIYKAPSIPHQQQQQHNFHFFPQKRVSNRTNFGMQSTARDTQNFRLARTHDRSPNNTQNKLTDNSFVANTSRSATSLDEHDPDTLTLQHLEMNFPKLTSEVNSTVGQPEGSIRSYKTSRDNKSSKLVRQELIPKSAKIFFNNLQATSRVTRVNQTSKLSWYSYDDRRKHFSDDNLHYAGDDNKSEKNDRKSLNRGNLPPATTPTSQLLIAEPYQNRLRYNYSVLLAKKNMSRTEFRSFRHTQNRADKYAQQQATKSHIQMNDLIQNMKPERRTIESSQLNNSFTESSTNMFRMIDKKNEENKEQINPPQEQNVNEDTTKVEQSEDYYPTKSIETIDEKIQEKFELKIEIPFENEASRDL